MDAQTRCSRLGLLLVIGISACLNLYRVDTIGINGIGNFYYAAGVKSMLMNGHNFLYLSFDPAGFLSLDKAPLALWLQAASARLFGFNGLALLLPQVLAGVLSVCVLYWLVRRAYGVGAGLLAAFVLAVMPISVVTSRNNTPDALMVLFLLLAAGAVTLSVERSSLRWLLIGAALVGLAFNVKMLQVLLVVPALAVLFIVASPLPWRKRVVHGLLACVVMLAVALPWMLAVEFTPAGQRPYVGGSTNNSVFDLVFGYNGLARLWGEDWSSEIGAPGPLRLFNDELGGQMSWLLPLALVGLLIAAWQMRSQQPDADRTGRRNALVLWTTWLVTSALYFSVSVFYHRYYLATMAPAVAALAGIGTRALWTVGCRGKWPRVWAVLALALTAVVQAALFLPFAGWNAWLMPAVIGSLLGAGALALVWRKGWDCARLATRAAFTCALMPLLFAPMVWTIIPVAACVDYTRPYAGPQVTGASQACEPFAKRPFLDRGLVDYLLQNRQGARYLGATYDLSISGLGILETGEPFMTLGGYRGSDPILTKDEFAQVVANGEVRFFLGLTPDNEDIPVARETKQWVKEHCPLGPELMKGVELRGPCTAP